MAKIINLATKPVLEPEIRSVSRVGNPNSNSWLNPKFNYVEQNASSHANSDNFRKRQLKRMRDAGWKK